MQAELKGQRLYTYCAYLKSLIPFFDRCFIITCMRFEEIHILFGKFIFASEAAHRRSTKLPEKTVANAELSVQSELYLQEPTPLPRPPGPVTDCEQIHWKNNLRPDLTERQQITVATPYQIHKLTDNFLPRNRKQTTRYKLQGLLTIQSTVVNTGRIFYGSFRFSLLYHCRGQ